MDPVADVIADVSLLLLAIVMLLLKANRKPKAKLNDYCMRNKGTTCMFVWRQQRNDCLYLSDTEEKLFIRTYSLVFLLSLVACHLSGNSVNMLRHM